MSCSNLTEPERADIYGFRIVEDTREQKPLDFSAVTDIPSTVATLHTGDYSATGYEDSLTIERKSVDDLIGTVIRGRARFECELERMRKTHRLYAIFCEGTWADVRLHAYQGFANPLSVLGSLDAWHARFGVPTYYCSRPYCYLESANILRYRAEKEKVQRLNRIEMAERIASIIKYYVREQVGKKEWDRRMRMLKRLSSSRSARGPNDF